MSHVHHWIIEEARGRLTVEGVCTCGETRVYQAYWDETPPAFGGKKKQRSYGTDPLSKLRVKW